MPEHTSSEPSAPPPGLAARRIAADIVSGVLRQKRPLDELLEASELHELPERDRALVRTIVATVLRRLGTLRHLLAPRLENGLPPSAPQVEAILLIGAAQILFLDVPDHAAVDLSVRLAQADRHASHYSGLVNAVLRKLARDGKSAACRARHRAARYAGLADAALDRALRRGHRARHRRGASARAGARSHGQAAMPPRWATTLGGRVLPTGTVRTVASGPIPQLPGYDDGAWWVQDAAAALPARLLGDVRGKSVADLCAAPGGKTAQLAARRRPRHRGRPLAAAARTAAAESARLQLDRRNRQGRRRSMARRAVRRRAARRALLIDRHHPPPSRHPLAEVRGRSRQAHRPASPAARSRRGAAQARRHAGLLHLLAGERGGRGPDRGPAGPPCRPAPQPDRAGEVGGPCRTSDRRGRASHPALPLARSRTPGWPGSTASTPPESSKNGES